MVPHDAGRDRLAAAELFQLDEQAVGEGLGADTGRVEAPQEFGGGLYSFQGQVRKQGEVGQCGGQVAAVIQAADKVAQGLQTGGAHSATSACCIRCCCREVSVVSES